MITAGCTQVSGTSPGTTAALATATATPAPATPVPTVAETAVPTAAATSVPDPTVTIVHQISLTRDIKDSALLYSLQVPVEWTRIESYRIENPENFMGEMYQTDLVTNNTFYIHTFTNYRSRDQNYRDEAKRWVPAPNATVVKINGLTFDRFESTSNGITNVTYVMRQSDMNDLGYLSVLMFSADTTSNRFAVEDYDKVVSSFRYYAKDKVGTMPGEEITRILPDEGEPGNMRSAVSGGSSSASSSSSSSRCQRGSGPP